MNRILVTGGAGFIGANFVLRWPFGELGAIINPDKLACARKPGAPEVA